MPIYHVANMIDGIYAGTINKPNKQNVANWRNCTECTEEAINAVRDYFMEKASGTNSLTYGYEWTRMTDGAKIRLSLEIIKDETGSDENAG